MKLDLLLSTAYWGTIEYYSEIYKSEKIILERFEHYPKQTFRNRCVIYGASGPLSLSIPVTKGNAVKAYTKDIRIDNSSNWQKIHIKAIESAYGCSPFFIYYIDEIQPFYTRNYEFLYDFNLKCMSIVFSFLDIKRKIEETDKYISILTEHTKDIRETIHPKNTNSLLQLKPYRQVFEPKLGFHSNLSILDLIFNTGPEAKTYM